jgi:hypothetical protein
LWILKLQARAFATVGSWKVNNIQELIFTTSRLVAFHHHTLATQICDSTLVKSLISIEVLTHPQNAYSRHLCSLRFSLCTCTYRKRSHLSSTIFLHNESLRYAHTDADRRRPLWQFNTKYRLIWPICANTTATTSTTIRRTLWQFRST